MREPPPAPLAVEGLAMRTREQVQQLLEAELGFLEAGGYGERRTRRWRPALFFEDSPRCPNHGAAGPRVPCSECAWSEFVPEADRERKLACRLIPLSPQGETLDELYRWATEEEMLAAVHQWLQQTLNQSSPSPHAGEEANAA